MFHFVVISTVTWGFRQGGTLS